jgi:hypothetical protein
MELREFRRSGFHVEEAGSRTRIDRGRAMPGMPFGSGTAHVVKLGAVGFDERLEQADELGKFSGQHRPFPSVHLKRFSCRRHDVLLSAEFARLFSLPCGLSDWSLAKAPGFSGHIRRKFVKIWFELVALFVDISP